MMRRFFIISALALALFLTWQAWEGWLYIQRGYSLGVALEGEPRSVYHVDFPRWRAAVHVALWVAAMASIAAYVAGRQWASTAAWLTFAAVSTAGLLDVAEYGTMGSATSIWTVLLLLLFALLTRFGTLAPRAAA